MRRVINPAAAPKSAPANPSNGVNTFKIVRTPEIGAMVESNNPTFGLFEIIVTITFY